MRIGWGALVRARVLLRSGLPTLSRTSILIEEYDSLRKSDFPLRCPSDVVLGVAMASYQADP